MKAKKVKNFPPSLKENNRYLLIKGKKEEFFKIQKEFLGLIDFSEASFKIIDEEKDFFLVKCNVKVLDKIRASFCLYDNSLKIVRVFGTIKKYKNLKSLFVKDQVIDDISVKE